MTKNDWTSNLIVWVIGASLIIGVLTIIGIWYVLVAIVATVIVVLALRQGALNRKKRDAVLTFDKALQIPDSIASSADSAPFSAGPSRVEVDLVELDRYSSNWDQFKIGAQVARAGTVRVHGLVVCFQSSTGEKGILLAHDGNVLGEVRQLDLPIYFDALWDQGGVVRAGCHFRFDSKLEVQRATFEMQVYNTYSGDVAPPTGPVGMWLTAWNILRGKSG